MNMIIMEFSDITPAKTVEELKDEFRQKVVKPFEKFARKFDRKISEEETWQLLYVRDDDFDPDNEIGWMAVSFPFDSGKEQRDEPMYAVHFYLDGTAELVNLIDEEEKIEMKDSWSEVFKKFMKIVKQEIEKIQDQTQKIDWEIKKINRAIKILNG